jgi:8-oxo-dGTP pyrophosphatase MutT (NUDIX family)
LSEFGKSIRSILDAHEPQVWSEENLTPAAVLIPLFVKDGEVSVLLTIRTDQVETHKGQIAFPGGAHEDNDRDMLATALRETEEEVGIRQGDVQVLGQLDQVITVTDFIVTPFVGVIPYPYDFAPNRDEIKELIEIPLSFFLNVDNLRTENRDFQGKPVTVHFYEYGPHIVWGVTSRILRGFLTLLRNRNGRLPPGFPRVR